MIILVIKQRMQLSGDKKCLQCFKKVVNTEGLSALYRSLPITLLMNGPYHISTVVINEHMKKLIKPKEREYKFLSYFVCAAVAGMVSSFITCPMDNVKTKLQTQNTVSSCEILEAKISKDFKGCEPICEETCFPQTENSNKNQEKKPDKIKYRNIKETVLQIYREDGIKKGFFRGVGPRMTLNSPSCAISWGSYEIMKHLLTDYL